MTTFPVKSTGTRFPVLSSVSSTIVIHTSPGINTTLFRSWWTLSKVVFRIGHEGLQTGLAGFSPVDWSSRIKHPSMGIPYFQVPWSLWSLSNGGIGAQYWSWMALPSTVVDQYWKLSFSSVCWCMCRYCSSMVIVGKI